MGQLQVNGGPGAQGWVHSVCSKCGLQGEREGQHPRKKSRDMRQKAGKGSTQCPPKPFTPQAQPVCPQLCLSWLWNLYPNRPY